MGGVTFPPFSLFLFGLGQVRGSSFILHRIPCQPFRGQPKGEEPDSRSVGAEGKVKGPDWRRRRWSVAGRDPISSLKGRVDGRGKKRVEEGRGGEHRSRTGTETDITQDWSVGRIPCTIQYIE
jgi:hypothetical protein